MAYFCPDTNVRLVAPGKASTVPAFEHDNELHEAAEHAAAATLANNPAGPHAPPSDALIESARKAALAVIDSAPAKAPDPPPEPKAPDPEAQPVKPTERASAKRN